MQKHLILLITVFSLILGSSVYAHDGLLTHPQMSTTWGHTILHMLMLLPLGVGVYFLSRWLLNRQQR